MISSEKLEGLTCRRHSTNERPFTTAIRSVLSCKSLEESWENRQTTRGQTLPSVDRYPHSLFPTSTEGHPGLFRFSTRQEQ